MCISLYHILHIAYCIQTHQTYTNEGAGRARRDSFPAQTRSVLRRFAASAVCKAIVLVDATNHGVRAQARGRSAPCGDARTIAGTVYTYYARYFTVCDIVFASPFAFQ